VNLSWPGPLLLFPRSVAERLDDWGSSWGYLDLRFDDLEGLVTIAKFAKKDGAGVPLVLACVLEDGAFGEIIRIRANTGCLLRDRTCLQRVQVRLVLPGEWRAPVRPAAAPPRRRERTSRRRGRDRAGPG
jgi:hypothetical protein